MIETAVLTGLITISTSLIAALVLVIKWFMRHTDNHETHTAEIMRDLVEATRMNTETLNRLRELIERKLSS